jgi:hypothetical protein
MSVIDLISYVAKPSDNRCQWWSAVIPDDLSVDQLGTKVSLTYLRRNGDYEFPVGTMLIDSEQVHHRKSRGYNVNFGLVTSTGIKWMSPTLAIKKMIKEEGHMDLMAGSGDIDACWRIALYLRRQGNVEESFNMLKQIQ